jgi:hypothetical protein
MLKKLIPRDEGFFDMFNDICGNIVKGAITFQAMMKDSKSLSVHAETINRIEHETDDLVHNLLSKLHKSFITPLDRDDIHKLAHGLDDIIDLTHMAAMNILHYKPKKLPKELLDLSGVLLESAVKIRDLISLIRDVEKNSSRIMEISVEINRLENEADTIRRHGMARLFQTEKNAIELIKMKDILSFIENATDRCEDVSDIVEGIVLENA